MTRRTLVVLGTLAAVALLLGACGDDEAGLFLKLFRQPKVTLVTGQNFPLVVALSKATPDKLYVDIENPLPGTLEFDPTFLTYRSGEAEQTVTVVGRDSTSDFVTVNFSIRDTEDSVSWKVKVESP